MMNRDATIVQVAILLIIIAIIGVAILKQQRTSDHSAVYTGAIVPIQEADTEPVVADARASDTPIVVDTYKPSVPQEELRSDNVNIVKEYFRYVAEKNYTGACTLVSGSKCNASKPVAVENFSREFNKLLNGYEYVNVKDFGFVAPSGKEIVCVKYSYRYKEDPQPGLVSEVMSFYVDRVGSELKITDRVCEKKYKEGRGLRDCPIEAAAEFCEGRIK